MSVNWGWVAAIAILLLLACWFGVYRPNMGGMAGMHT